MAVLPTEFLYLSSLGLTAIAKSPRIVSGLVVAIIIYPSSSFRGYFIDQIWLTVSSWSTSASDIAVLQFGHQFIILSPCKSNPFHIAL